MCSRGGWRPGPRDAGPSPETAAEERCRGPRPEPRSRTPNEENPDGAFNPLLVRVACLLLCVYRCASAARHARAAPACLRGTGALAQPLVTRPRRQISSLARNGKFAPPMVNGESGATPAARISQPPLDLIRRNADSPRSVHPSRHLPLRPTTGEGMGEKVRVFAGARLAYVTVARLAKREARQVPSAKMS